MGKAKWNYETLKEEALKYSTINEFRKSNRVALEKIQKLGLQDDLCSHLTYATRPDGYWTEFNVRKHASECNTRSEFCKKHNTGYRKASELEILDEIFGELSQRSPNYWNEEKIIEASKKCNGRKDFQLKFSGAYSAAKKFKMLDELFPNKLTGKSQLYWTIEKILEVYDQNMTVGEFAKKHNSAYNAAFRSGFLKDLKFKKVGSKFKRCIYAIEFKDKSVCVGLTYNFETRIYDHFNHKTKISSARKYHIENPGLKYECIQLSEYIEYERSGLEESSIIDIYKSDGWKILNKAKAGGLGGFSENYWDKAKSMEAALKYDRPTDYSKSIDRGGYKYAAKHNFLHELIYKKNRLIKRKWNKELVLEVVKNYSNHKELSLSDDRGAYDYARKNNFLKELKYKQ